MNTFQLQITAVLNPLTFTTFFEYLCRATGNILKVCFLISLFKFCDSCNLCLYYGLLIVLQLSVVHVRKSQVHSYQRHGNFVTAKRTPLLTF